MTSRSDEPQALINLINFQPVMNLLDYLRREAGAAEVMVSTLCKEQKPPNILPVRPVLAYRFGFFWDSPATWTFFKEFTKAEIEHIMDDKIIIMSVAREAKKNYLQKLDAMKRMGAALGGNGEQG